MSTLKRFILPCLVFTWVASMQAAELVPVTALTGSNGGDQYANGMNSLTNGSGITKTNATDPSTWAFSGNLYQDEWMAWYMKTGGVSTVGLNGKLAWASFDVGTKQPLGKFYIFNNNYGGGISGVAQFNLYWADSPTVPLPAAPAKNTFANTGLTPQGDYDFSGGGWTLINTAGALTAAKSAISSFDLPGVSARYLAVEILGNYGDTYLGGRVGFDEVAVTVGPPDTDGDGFPDAYELTNTIPASATALNRDDDLEPDGLTNWQEFLRGTNPRVADTDGDGLSDGSEVAGAGLRPPTNPVLVDTDGDGLSDLAEKNTGIFVSVADPGTNPAKADTDGDGFKDNIETNTGVNGGATNPGTSPLLADSDGDGAGDWYEVVATFTNPNSAASKPNVPYPLPKPDGSTGATNKPIKVFILSGQSNMVGMGTVNGTDSKALSYITRTLNRFPNLIDSSGNFIARQDVKYRGVISAIGNGPLAPGFGANSGVFGPELGFGHIMGWYHDEPVLLLKSSIGNRSLGWDCLPPGSGRFAIDTNTYAGYGDYDDVWPTANGEPAPFVWYAGKQYDDYFLAETNMGAPAWADATYYYTNGIQVRHNGQIYNSKGGAHTSSPNSEPGVGASWTTRWDVHAIINVVDVLDNWATQYTNWASQGFEIAGFVWWQGDKDRYNLVHATRYETNLVKLITSLRTYYSNRYPGKVVTNAPFVLATLGQTILGDNSNPAEKAILDGMLAVDGKSGKYSQFAGNVKTVYAHPLSEGGASNSHYDGRAGTYMLVGDALGRGMIELLTGTAVPTNDYSNWATNFPGVNLGGPNADFDGDGRGNDYERIWGLNPTNAVSNNPFTFTASLASGTFSYTRRDSALTGLAYTIWTSTNLVNWAQDAGAIQTPGAAVNQIQNVSVTVSPGLLTGPQLFMRVRAQ